MTDNIGELTDEVLAAYADGLQVDIVEAVDLVPLLAAKLLELRSQAKTEEHTFVLPAEVATSQLLFAAIRQAGGRLTISDREVVEMKGATISAFRGASGTTYVLETGTLQKMKNTEMFTRMEQLRAMAPDWESAYNSLNGPPDQMRRFWGIEDPAIPLPPRYARLAPQQPPPPKIAVKKKGLGKLLPHRGEP